MFLISFSRNLTYVHQFFCQRLIRISLHTYLRIIWLKQRIWTTILSWLRMAKIQGGSPKFFLASNHHMILTSTCGVSRMALYLDNFWSNLYNFGMMDWDLALPHCWGRGFFRNYWEMYQKCSWEDQNKHQLLLSHLGYN